MPDDRDRYKPKTPPMGVRAQTAPPQGEFDKTDLTPVYGTPEVQTLKRAEQAAGESKSAAGSSKATLKIAAELKAAQDSLAAQVRDYAETDQSDHREMKTAISELKGDLGEVKGDVKDLARHMGDVREIAGELKAWTDQLALDKQNEAHEQRIRLTYKTKVKAKVWETVLKIVGAIFIAGAGVLGTYEMTRWLQR